MSKNSKESLGLRVWALGLGMLLAGTLRAETFTLSHNDIAGSGGLLETAGFNNAELSGDREAVEKACRLYRPSRNYLNSSVINLDNFAAGSTKSLLQFDSVSGNFVAQSPAAGASYAESISCSYADLAPTVSCQVFPDPYSNNLEEYLNLSTPAGQAQMVASDYWTHLLDPDRLTQLPNYVTTRFSNRVFFRVYCSADRVPAPARLSEAGTFGGALGGSGTLCSPHSAMNGGFCVEVKKSLNPLLRAPNVAELAGVLVLRNLQAPGSNRVQSIQSSDVNFAGARFAGSAPSAVANLGTDLSVHTPAAGACRIVVSGALDSRGSKSIACPDASSCNPTEVTDVQNGSLIMKAIVEGGATNETAVTSVVWSGDYSGTLNDATWDPRPGTPLKVVASVSTPSGTTHCGVLVRAAGTPFLVKLKKAGDCSLYSSLKKYYLWDPATNGGARVAPFSPPVTIPGSSAKFGAEGPDVPFRGVLNAAFNFAPHSATNSVARGIERDSGGRVITPEPEGRRYSKAVIVAYRYRKRHPGTAAQPAGSPAYYGLLDLSDYSNTQMIPVPGQEEPAMQKDNLLVFQVFLAASVMRNGQDLRGQVAKPGDPANPNYWDFIPHDASNRPFDRIVPLMYSSCLNLFRLGPPVRQESGPTGNPGNVLPSALRGTDMCLFSRPMRFEDFQNGRLSLDVLHLVPEIYQSKYPTDLLKNNATTQSAEACHVDTTMGTPPMRSCWNIESSQMPTLSEVPDHASCKIHVKKTCGGTSYSYQVCDYWGCRTQTGSTPAYDCSYDTFLPSCAVGEFDPENECGANLAIRFSGYNMMMGAALGCVAKYDSILPGGLSGVEVSPTLPNQGILPYSDKFGGSIPKAYTDYPPYFLGTSRLPAQPGYGCIPCRFSLEGKTLSQDTARLPLDQDNAEARVPIFKFTKGKAPVQCMAHNGNTPNPSQDTRFQIRYFGAASCNGTTGAANDFCGAANIGATSCPGKTDTVSELLDGDPTDPRNRFSRSFSGSGNLAGDFRVPLCPGSGFGFDSVSVSWSPLIVDLGGHGIRVSRSYDQAVAFDIRASGEAVKIDWPSNTHEVAFLVKPDEKGGVHSIKELFGDYRAKNGFEALRKLDSHRDGRIDAKDRAFTQLALWFDRNRNGLAEAGELQKLADSDVSAIYLKYLKPKAKGIEGRTLEGLYFNKKTKGFAKIEDHYFYEYWKNGKRIAEK